MRGNVWLVESLKFDERGLLIASTSGCMEMRGTAARKYVEMRGTVACVGMRVAWTPPNRGSSARDANGKHTGSAAQVRLKRVELRFHTLVGPVFLREGHVKG